MSHAEGSYYVPHGSHWPIIGSIGLTTLLVGFSLFLNQVGIGKILMMGGVVITIFMMFGWFRTVVLESEQGTYNEQVDRSFRWGMFWFIFSEVMFFAAFFGALYYARQLSLPWLGGAGAELSTNTVLHPGFESGWPSNGPGELGGAFKRMGAWGLPAINTMLLLTSGVTLTITHHALKHGQRGKLKLFLFFTIVLGTLFLAFQVMEYAEAYQHLNLKLTTGIYGSTFFMLTGFHGMHVTIGVIMLTVMLFRIMKGHFDAKNHFGFEAVAWYWHFVDVVWLGLFIFVYWI